MERWSLRVSRYYQNQENDNVAFCPHPPDSLGRKHHHRYHWHHHHPGMSNLDCRLKLRGEGRTVGRGDWKGGEGLRCVAVVWHSCTRSRIRNRHQCQLSGIATRKGTQQTETGLPEREWGMRVAMGHDAGRMSG